MQQQRSEWDDVHAGMYSMLQAQLSSAQQR